MGTLPLPPPPLPHRDGEPGLPLLDRLLSAHTSAGALASPRPPPAFRASHVARQAGPWAAAFLGQGLTGCGLQLTPLLTPGCALSADQLPRSARRGPGAELTFRPPP